MKRRKLSDSLEFVIIFVAILYRYLGIWGFIDSNIRYLIFFPFMIATVFLILWKKKFQKKEFEKILIILLFSVYIFFSSNEIDLIISLMMALIFLKEDGDKSLIKNYFIISTIFFIITIILYQSGILIGRDTIRNLDGNIINRQSLGFGNVNTPFMYLLPILIGINLLYFTKNNKLLLYTIICGIVSFIIYKLTDSRTGVFIIIFYLLCLWINKYNPKFFSKRKTTVFLFICIGITIGFTIYGKDINSFLNRMLTNRPYIINNYFSSGFPPILWGKMVVSLDNTYAWLLYVNGIIATCIYIWIFFKSTKKIGNNSKINLLIVVYLLYFIFERVLIYATNFIIVIQIMYIITNHKEMLWLEKEEE